MATLKSKDNKEMIISCKCGCGDSLRISIEESYGDFAYQTYMKNNFADEQCGVFKWIGIKLRKIWCIICNKDYYYSDIVLSKEDWAKFKDFVNKK